MAEKTKKSEKISGWRMLWDNLEAGPRGALIAFLIIVAYFIIPLAIKVIAIIVTIIIATLFGAAVGSLIGWLYRKLREYKKSRKSHKNGKNKK